MKSFFARVSAFLGLMVAVGLVSPGAQAQPAMERALREAGALGAPLATVRRAFTEVRDPVYRNKNFLAIFDLSQHSSRRRFYLIDLVSGGVEAFHVSHGTGNGPAGKANRFRGFDDPDRNMTPMGPLVTDSRDGTVQGYDVVRDPVTGERFGGLRVLGLNGTKPYNFGINGKGAWVVFHSKNYATEGFRRRNAGAMGRSHGCIVLDPKFVNRVIGRLAGGALVYVTVGDQPAENFGGGL